MSKAVLSISRLLFYLTIRVKMFSPILTPSFNDGKKEPIMGMQRFLLAAFLGIGGATASSARAAEEMSGQWPTSPPPPPPPRDAGTSTAGTGGGCSFVGDPAQRPWPLVLLVAAPFVIRVRRRRV